MTSSLFSYIKTDKKNYSTSFLTTLGVTAATVSTAIILNALLFSSRNKKNNKQIMTVSAPELPEGTVTASLMNRRNQKLHTLYLKKTSQDTPAPAKTNKVFFVHGVGDHSGRPCYTRLYDYIVNNIDGADNFELFSLDLHGHGQSEGTPRVYCEHYTDYVNDLVDLIKANFDPQVDQKMHIIGHSLGALIAALAACELPQDQIAGLILSAPATGVEMDVVMRVQKALGPILDCVAPRAKIVDAVRIEDLTRDEKEKELFEADPLVERGNIRVHTGLQIDTGFTLLKANRSKITCPLLVLHGTIDKVTEPKSSKDFFENVGSTQKLFVSLEGFYHEIFNEPERDGVMTLIGEFLVTTTSLSSDFASFPKGHTVGDDRILTLNLVDEKN